MLLRIRVLMGISLLAVLLTFMPVTAQQPAENILPPVNADCVTVERLMDLGVAPDQLIESGGTLTENSVVQADITPEDAGDRWLVAAPFATTLGLEFETTLPLQVQVFNRLDTVASETLNESGRVEIALPAAGYYTLLVSRVDPLDQAITGRYSLAISGGLADGLTLDAPVTIPVNNEAQSHHWLFYNQLASGQNEAPLTLTLTNDLPVQVRLLGVDGTPLLDQRVEAGMGFTSTVALENSGYYGLEIDPLAAAGTYTLTLSSAEAQIGQVAQPRWEQPTNQQALLPDNGFIPLAVSESLQLALPPDLVSNIAIGPSVRLSFSDEDAIRFVQQNTREMRLLDGDLNITLANGGTIYVQDYPWQGELSDEASSFSTLALPDEREVRVDWNNAAGIWVLPQCIGVKLQTGQKLIAEGQTLGARPTSTINGFPINVTGEVEYTLNVDWVEINRILASNGLITLDFANGTVVTDQTQLNVRRTNEGDTIQQVIRADDTLYISTDWENIEQIESIGDQVVIAVADEREQIERTGRTLQSLETQAGVMLMRWQDTSASLILPESEDFIQIETPAAQTSYSATALPGEADYLPANFNNTGQECYPVNTLELNCAPNGLVNPANGNLSIAISDLYARGSHLDLVLSRTYNSQNSELDSPFGYGWNTDYLLDFDVPLNNAPEIAPAARLITAENDYRMSLDVQEALQGRIIFTTASGSRHLFEADEAGAALTSPTLPGWRIEARLQLLADNWQLYRSDGRVYQFDRAGRLRGISHPHGGMLSISAEQPFPNAIYRITDEVGRSLRLEYDADMHITRSSLYAPDETLLGETLYRYNEGRLTEVTYEDGSTATYQYENGVLVSHTDHRAPIATTLIYTYDEVGRVIAIAENADAQPYRTYTYTPGNNNLVTAVTDEWGRTTLWRFTLTDNPTTSYLLAGRTFPGQEETTYQYTDRGNTLTTIRYPGYNLSVNFADNGDLAVISNVNAFFEYRADYQDVRIGAQTVALLSQYQVGGQVQGNYSYDNEGNLLTYTNPDGVVTTVAERDPVFGLPMRLTVTYPNSQPTEETIMLTYNDLGYLSSRTDLQGTTRYEWDSIGQLTGYTDVLGRVYTLTYKRDASGQCVTITDPLLSATITCYDARMNLIEQRVTSGETALEQTRYTYDSFDRLREMRQTLAEGDLVTQYVYLSGLEPGTWRLEVTDPYNLTTTTEYDAQDRVIREIDTLGRETTFAYDDQTVLVTAPNGVTTTLTYNLANQLCTVEYADTEWQLFYDPQGTRCNEPRRQISRIVIPNRLEISFEDYDNSGRLESLTYRVQRPGDTSPGTLAQPDPFTITYGYDERGQPTLFQQEQGTNTTTAYQWDETGQRTATVSTTNPDGSTQQMVATYDVLNRVTFVESVEGTTSYTYTDLPEQHLFQVDVAFNDADGTTQSWRLVYNTLGNLVQWTNADRVVTTYEYDQVSRLRRVLINERLEAEYTYNAAGFVTSITNREGRVRRFVYDTRGQLTTTRDFNNVVTVYTYDPNGNLSTITDALGNTTTYLYDERNRLTNIINPVGRTQTFNWTEAQLGQLTYRDAQTTIDYYFDLFGKLWQVRDPAGTRHFFRYAPTGELTQFEPAGGELTLAMGYNADGQLTSLSDGENWNWLYRYDNRQRLIERQDPDGNLITFNYDQLGRLTNLDVPNSDPNYTRQYVYPAPGNLNLRVGTFQTEMLYDEFYRLTEERVTNQATPSPETFVTRYEYEQDETYTVTDPLGVQRVYTYTGTTGLDQEVFLTVTEGSRQWLYTLNARGELVAIERLDQVADQVYTRREEMSYDSLGRPIRYVDADGNLYGFSYDTAGNLRTIQNPDGSSYTYTYDDLHRLTSITNAGNQVIDLGYNTLNQLETIQLDNTALESYTYNGLGWITSRTNAAGTIDYQYNNVGRVTGWSTADGTEVSLSYTPGAFTRLANVQQGVAGTQPPLEYTYNTVGELIEASTGVFGQAFTLDVLGRVNSWVHLQSGEVWNYQFGEDGRSYTLTIGADGDRQLQFLLDENGRLQQMVANTEPIDVNYRLRGDNNLEVELTWGDNYTSQVRFNRLGHIVRVVHDRQGDITFNRSAYSYALNYFGLPQSIDEATHDVFVGYDSAYRPLTTRWLYSGSDRNQQRDSIEYAFSLTYDDLGNRRTQLVQDIDGNQRSYRYTYNDTLLRQRTSDEAILSGTIILVGLGWALASRKRKVIAAALLVLPLIAILAASGLSAQQPPNGPTVTYTYNDAGQLITITDLALAEGQNTTQFTYDGYGRLLTITYPDATSSTLTYDAFGRLISWQNAATGRLDYRYDGNRLAQITRDGVDGLVLNVDQMPLLLVENTASNWYLFDGLETLRQQFVETHTNNALNYEVDYFGVQLALLSDAELPGGLPIFDSMLYDPGSQLYIGLNGRAYDPAAGRYLQPDLLGPDASGNVYSYRLERNELLVQDRNAYPFMEGLEALLTAQQQSQVMTAEMTLTAHLPTFEQRWQDMGLAALQSFNQGGIEQVQTIAEVSNWLGYQYNPAGVVNIQGQFRLNPLSPDLPEMALVSRDFAPRTGAIEDVLSLVNHQMAWIDAPQWTTDWRPLAQWQVETVAPQPVRGFRSPALALEVFAYPLTEIGDYDQLMLALENLPVQPADDWLAEIDAQTLPAAPAPLPESGLGWLDQWFTTDTFATWPLLRDIYDLPDIPANTDFSLTPQAETHQLGE